MAEVRLEMGEHPLSPETRERFPWARNQPPYTRAELNRVVAEAGAMKQEWRTVRDGLDGLVPRLEASERAARASAPGSQGSAGEIAGFLSRGRILLAAGNDPERLAGYAGAGSRTPGEVVRLVLQGVRPADMRALNAVGRMRAGTETLRVSLLGMRGLRDRIEQAGPRWPGWHSGSEGAAAASTQDTPSSAVGRVLADPAGRPVDGAHRAGGSASAAPSPRRHDLSGGAEQGRSPRSR